MKKISLVFVSLLVMFSVLIGNVYAGLNSFNTDSRKDILVNKPDNVMDDIGDDVMQKATNHASEDLEGIHNDTITDSKDARDKTMKYIRNVVNYFLGLLGFFSLLYLIYSGVLIITSNGDEGKFKKGVQGIKITAIVILGIGVSWLFISLIVYLIQGSL